MDPSRESALGAFFQALADEPLAPNDERYVPIGVGRSASGRGCDPISRIVQRIRWAPRETVQLLSGLRGTGKSTELRQLSRRLAPDGFVVAWCDLARYLASSMPIEIEEVLVALTRALSDAFAGLGLGGQQLPPMGATSLVRLVESVASTIFITCCSRPGATSGACFARCEAC